MLFDLDGTLVDTAPDMIAALNQLRGKRELDPLPLDQLRNVVSQGAIGLLKAGMPGGDDEQREAWRLEFLEIYQQHLCVDSALFEGMEKVLDALQAYSIPWGVVTNKPGGLARPLLASLGLDDHMACVVAGDDLTRRKPDPAPLLHACQTVGVEPARTVYVGDAEGDIIAAGAAGCRSVIARYGYIAADRNPRNWGGDAVIDHPDELIAMLFPELVQH